VDVVAVLPADAQSTEPVQECEGVFDDPSVDTEPGAVHEGFALHRGEVDFVG
jgi:hypothetical protein